MKAGKKLNVASLNAHLICVICSGYYVEATTIIECLHTFCRSCIINYLKTNKFCPICDVQINHSKPWSSLRTDKTMQDLVYKLVPGLYQDEMRRRRQFYSGLNEDPAGAAEGEEKGLLPHGARFFAQDDSISLSLEYYSGENETDSSVNGNPKRYLQCPAAVTVRHLKKFLQMKYGIGVDGWVDIIYNDECLPDYFTLIDVAYTFTWQRTSPMRLSYRIFTKKAVKIERTGNKATSNLDDGRKSIGKQTSSLEQQKQNEYLENFNLNPTKSDFSKSQNNNNNNNNNNNSSSSNNNSNNNNNNNNNNGNNNNNYNSNQNNNNNNNSNSDNSQSINNNNKNNNHNNNNNNNNNNNTTNVTNSKHYGEIKNKVNKDELQMDEISGDKVFPSSEDSNASGLRIISEKEESLKENSDESLSGTSIEKKKECEVQNFSEEAEDGFAAKKLLKSRHKSDCKKEKKKHDVQYGEKRRRSMGHGETSDEKECSESRKRRKRVIEGFIAREDEEPLANLKNEALRKVFVMKEKPEMIPKEGEFRRKKRKKSKHHEGEPKKKRMEMIPTSPSILSFAKDPLKLKVKLTPLVKPNEEESKHVEKDGDEWECEKEKEEKKTVSDKERLLHLRAVRHKNIIKTNTQSYISAPRSLTISKVDANDQQTTKPRIVESRPSLEIMLIPPSDATKSKIGEEKKSEATKQVMDTFGVLDLSEKSTRAKESSASSPKDIGKSTESSKKSTQHSIMQIAQTLVNRKLSPMLPDKRFESDATTAAAAMRNLKTLSDTAVNILMAAQSKGFPPPPESPKRIYQSTSPNPVAKDCENGTGLKIPMFPVARERPNPIPPVPNLHEIYPKGRGRPISSLARINTTAIKPGQNQTVRQIPNPSALLNRQNNQLLNRLPVPQKITENGDLPSTAKTKLSSIPPLQSIRSKLIIGDDPRDKMLVPNFINNVKPIQNGSDNGLLSGAALKNGEEVKKLTKLSSNTMRRIESMARNIESVAAGLTARAASNAMIDAK